MQKRHLIKVLTGIWQAQGATVSLGNKPPPGTNGVIAHTDYSTVDDDFFKFVDPQLPIINGRARNILKSNVSQLLVPQSTDWSGPVIVKTNANSHAGEEYAYHGLDLIRLGRIFAGRILPWQWMRDLPFRRYPILDSIRDVPSWVWADERFVVERFAPERDGELFVLRLWMFLGDQEYCMRVCSEEPIVKSRKLVSVELVKEVPESVRSVRQQLGLDFGKIDFTMHDGEAVVFDVNKTPTVYLNKAGQPGKFVRRLADGLDSLLP